MRFAFVLGVGLLVLSASSAFAGDVQVIDSNVEKYPVGKILPDTEKLEDIPRDGRVRVLVLSSQATKVYDGKRGGRAGPIGGTRGIKPQ